MSQALTVNNFCLQNHVTILFHQIVENDQNIDPAQGDSDTLQLTADKQLSGVKENKCNC